MPSNEATYLVSHLRANPASLGADPPPGHFVPLLRATLQSFSLKVMAASLAALPLSSTAVAPGHAHIRPSALGGDVGPVDWGDAITTTSCRLTDKSRIGSGGLAGWLAGFLPFPKPAVIEEVTTCLTRPSLALRIGDGAVLQKAPCRPHLASDGVSGSSRHDQNVLVEQARFSYITQTIVCAPPSHTVLLAPLLLLHFCFGSHHSPCHAVLPWPRSLGPPGLTAATCHCLSHLARGQVPQQEGHNCSLQWTNL